MREVNLEEFGVAWVDGGLVVDVREPEEYVSGHVPGAWLMPLSTLVTRLGEVPSGRPVYVICASGNRSKTAADWMCAAGVDAYSVAGGTGGWARAGRPLVVGPNENAT